MKQSPLLTFRLSLLGLLLAIGCSSNVGNDTLNSHGPGDDGEGDNCEERCEAVYQECLEAKGDQEEGSDGEDCEQVRAACADRCAQDDPCGCEAEWGICLGEGEPDCERDDTGRCHDQEECEGDDECHDPSQCDGDEGCDQDPSCDPDSGECDGDHGHCDPDSGECDGGRGDCDPDSGECGSDAPGQRCDAEYAMCEAACSAPPADDCGYCVNDFTGCAQDNLQNPDALRRCVGDLVECVNVCLPDRPEPPNRPEPCDLCDALSDSCTDDSGDQGDWCEGEINECYDRCEDRPIDQDDCVEEYTRCLEGTDGEQGEDDGQCEEILANCAGAC